ncbi:MAG TPA: CsgG/HfaB family protein [Longimicrobiales bacterium]|nr:CsgG/HfaB family protein [Longimicrobiales bacterium]
MNPLPAPGNPLLRRSRLVGWVLVTGMLLSTEALAQQPGDSRPGIAVLPFAQGISIGPEKEDLGALSIGLQQILITELAQNPALRVVDRSVIRDLIAEQDLGTSGRLDTQTAARIGKLVGARYAFTGGFNDAGGEFRLDGRIVDVETSEILKAEQVTDRRENLYDVVMTLAERITRGLRLPPLTPAVRQERSSRGDGGIPREAVLLYSQAQFFQDRGQTERARQLYRRITTEFPRLTEAQQALRQMESQGS